VFALVAFENHGVGNFHSVIEYLELRQFRVVPLGISLVASRLVIESAPNWHLEN